MIKQKVKVGGELKFVNQSRLTKKDDGTFYVVYNSDMTVDYDSESVVKAQTEYNWAKSELESSDIEIKYHMQESRRKKLTLQTWYDYQEDLRDYVTLKDGVYSVLTDKPVKPVKPS